MVAFLNKKIIVGIPTSSLDGCDYHFIYDPKRKNWFLTNRQGWEGRNYLDRKLGPLQNYSNKMPLEDFNILKMLGY